MDPRRVYQDRNPQIVFCHRRVRAALRKGELTRPEECSKCGKGGRIEGHHPDYSKPLEVVWLCKPCHSIETPGINGENHHRARFTDEDIRVIRALHAEGMGARKIGKLYGCDPTTVARVFRRETWKHVE